MAPGRQDDRLVIAESLRHAVDAIQRWSTRGRSRGSTGLSPTDVWLLDRLATHAPARMSDLAAWQDVDRSTMTVQVARLVERDLAHRIPDPTDRRAVAVELTEQGRAVLTTHRAHAASLLDAAVDDWPDEELAQFSRYLTRFAASLDGALARRGVEPLPGLEQDGSDR